MKRIWRQIADKSRAYFLGDSVKGPGFVVIHTKIEMIECTIPRKVLRFSVDPAEMSKSFGTTGNYRGRRITGTGGRNDPRFPLGEK